MSLAGLCNDSLHHVVNECVNLNQPTTTEPPFGRFYATILLVSVVLVVWTLVDHVRGRRQ